MKLNTTRIIGFFCCVIITACANAINPTTASRGETAEILKSAPTDYNVDRLARYLMTFPEMPNGFMKRDDYIAQMNGLEDYMPDNGRSSSDRFLDWYKMRDGEIYTVAVDFCLEGDGIETVEIIQTIPEAEWETIYDHLDRKNLLEIPPAIDAFFNPFGGGKRNTFKDTSIRLLSEVSGPAGEALPSFRGRVSESSILAIVGPDYATPRGFAHIQAEIVFEC